MDLRLCIRMRLEMGLVEVEVLNWQHILQVVYQVKQNGIYSHNFRYLVTEYAFNVVLCSPGVCFFFLKNLN